MANKISVILDVATDKAVSGIKGFRQSINDADGSVNKFRAGAGSAFDSIKTAGVGMAAAAGTAIVAFGVKSVNVFTDSAVAAGKFADATGLSTEEASKWVAVGDDIGISAESMEKSFGKLAVSIGKGNPLLEQYGITVQKGADGQADMNKTMLHAIDVIRGIQDPTKKAAVAQAALGKGWMEMAELIDQGSVSLTKSMDAVSEAQVIDPAEVEKARKMREAMDNLQDAFRDVSLVLGEKLIPSVVVLADGLTLLVGQADNLTKALLGPLPALGEWVGLMDDAKESSEGMAGGVARISPVLKELNDTVAAHIEFQEGMKDSTEAATEATEHAKKGTGDFEKALEDLNDAMEERIAADNELVGADIAVRDAQRDAAAAVAELTVAQNDGKLSADELAAAQDEAAGSLIEAAQAAADYDVKLADAAGQTLNAKDKQDLLKQKLQEVAATLAPGSPLRTQLEGYIALLEGIPTEVVTNLRVTGATVTPSGDLIRPGQRASGGPVSAGQSYIVGEEGPELLTMGGSNGHVTPNGALGVGGMAVIVHPGGINLTGSRLTPDDVVNALSDFVRRNGPGPIRKLTGT